VIFHPEPQHLEDLLGLEAYLKSELNIQTIRLTSDEQQCHIKYKATADWPTLGRRLRKDLAKVKNKIADVPSEEIKNYTKTGTIIIDGIQLVAGELQVARYADLPANNGVVANFDGDFAVLLDVKIYPDLLAELFLREFVNRVQRLRKKAGLQPTDEVQVSYSTTDIAAKSEIEKMLSVHSNALTRSLRSGLLRLEPNAPMDRLIVEEDQEIADAKFRLYIFHTK
jgi:isoleucyl-tRNA synthetase